MERAHRERPERPERPERSERPEPGAAGGRWSTGGLAALSGCSVQQVRDLERLGVIPPAIRRTNGYREFGDAHVIALRAYRALALAIGPRSARSTMREMREMDYDEAVARAVALHVDLARAREEALAALRALDAIVEESLQEVPATPGDAMTITELSSALGVRSSALRFWEQEGLLRAERSGSTGARRYPPEAVREARIVVALRAGGYRIPDLRTVMASLRELGDEADARAVLRDRLHSIAVRADALLRAGTDLSDLLRSRAPDDESVSPASRTTRRGRS
ncbi:MerR family transcriptional regulator [Brachybacterium sp. DNPG3]